MRFGTMCERTGAKSSQCRCYLGAIVAYLFAGEAKAAWNIFQVGHPYADGLICFECQACIRLGLLVKAKVWLECVLV